MGNYVEKPGRDALWAYFGLSYASWLTLPRVLMHEMSDEWQGKMAELLKEYDEYWDFSEIDTGTRVQITRDGKLVKTPEWMINYRHPEIEFIDIIKKEQIECSGCSKKIFKIDALKVPRNGITFYYCCGDCRDW